MKNIRLNAVEYNCGDISPRLFDILTNKAKPISASRVENLIKRDLPEFAENMLLNVPNCQNPYRGQYTITDRHVIFVYSMIEHFISYEITS